MNEFEIITRHYRKIGAKGGKAGWGKAKARTAKQARKAANTRWKKARRK